MGIILGEAYKHLASVDTFDHRAHNLHTNRKTGALLASFNGIAFSLLQVSLPRKGHEDIAPSAAPGDSLPQDFPLTQDDIHAAIQKATAQSAKISF